MDRLITKAIVFCGLLAAAGAAWGWFLADTLGRGNLLKLMERAIGGGSSNSVWAVPVALVLVLFATWLAGYAVLRDALRAASSLHSLHYFVFPYLVAAMIVEGVSGKGFLVSVLIIAGYFVGFVGLELWQYRRRRRNPKKIQTLKGWAGFKQVAPVLTVGLVCYAAFYVLEHSLANAPEAAMVKMGGAAGLMFASVFGGMASVDFGQQLWLSICTGGLVGTMTGALAVMSLKEESGGPSIYRGAGTGLALGALVSGMMTGAMTVQVVLAHDLALNQARLLLPVILIWAACGALIGLLVTVIVHGLSAERWERRKLIANGVALAVLPVLVASYYAFSYVYEKDLGRDLLAKADRLEGYASWIGLGAFDSAAVDSGPVENTVIWVTRGGLKQWPQTYRYQHTVACCDELLRKYPKSAYRAAAIYLKFQGGTYEWHPREALDAWRKLRGEYPKEGYSYHSDRQLVALDYSLLGDYERVLKIGWSEAHYLPFSGVRRAAEVLGRWGDYAGMCRANIAEYQHDEHLTRQDRKDIRWWEDKLAYARRMRAEGRGPAARTDVIGVVTVDGKAQAGITVVILPAEQGDQDSQIRSSTSAASRGGLLAVTDPRGVYRVGQAPVGRYEILVVLPSDRFQRRRWQAQAQGLPFEAKGKNTVAPRVGLY